MKSDGIVARLRQRATLNGAVLAAALCCIASLSCAPRAHLRHPGAGGWRDELLPPHRALLLGEVTYAAEGERFNARIETVLDGADRCTVCVYSSLGAPVFCISAGPQSVTVETSGDRRAYGTDQHVAELDFFAGYPFTFGEAVRILAGVYGTHLRQLGSPDSLAERSGGTRYLWRDGMVGFSAVAGPGGRSLRKVEAAPVGVGRWSLSLDRFRHGVATSVRCTLSATYYFVVRYGTIRVREVGPQAHRAHAGVSCEGRE